MVTYVEEPLVFSSRPPAPQWGSDVVAEMLRRLGIEYAALNPGASFRGLHDSLVNYNSNERPGMVLCNHEEIAVAVAHGYAKYTNKAMAAIAHSNVGLLHASMGVFNAFVDRVPVFVMGGTGPMDSTRRRPWIDWIHTSNGQGGLIRDFTKWETQPASVEAFPEAMIRAWHVCNGEPAGPTYVCLDVGLQEQAIDPAYPVPLPDMAQFPLPAPLEPSPSAADEAARWLTGAEFPVILLGRAGQTPEAWRTLIKLAERLGAAVLADGKSPVSFPTSHPLLQAGIGTRPNSDFAAAIAQADVILALDRVDVAGTLRLAGASTSGDGAKRARLINVTLEPLAVRSWVSDYQEMPAADLPIVANVDRTVAALLERIDRALTDSPDTQRGTEGRTTALRARRERVAAGWEQMRQKRWSDAPISIHRLAGELHAVVGRERAKDAVLANVPLTWADGIWDFEQPKAYLGGDGGGGVGSGPGRTVGAALGARGSGRLVASILGDGDLLMSPSALWTAAHHRIPLLLVVANNLSYYNDEEHQERMAITRDRPVENRGIGLRMNNPSVDFAGLARDMGVEGFGPVLEPDGLAAAYKQALAAVDEGRPALVDVRITPR